MLDLVQEGYSRPGDVLAIEAFVHVAHVASALLIGPVALAVLAVSALDIISHAIDCPVSACGEGALLRVPVSLLILLNLAPWAMLPFTTEGHVHVVVPGEPMGVHRVIAGVSVGLWVSPDVLHRICCGRRRLLVLHGLQTDSLSRRIVPVICLL